MDITLCGKQAVTYIDGRASDLSNTCCLNVTLLVALTFADREITSCNNTIYRNLPVL